MDFVLDVYAHGICQPMSVSEYWHRRLGAMLVGVGVCKRVVGRICAGRKRILVCIDTNNSFSWINSCGPGEGEGAYAKARETAMMMIVDTGGL